MKGRATGTWVMHKIQQVLSPSKMPMMMDKFEAEVDLMFADLNQEVMVQQKLSSLQQGTNSVDKLIQQFEIHRPTSRLGDIGLVHHFEQALNSHLRENIYRLRLMPRTWAEWKCKASILDNQWRWFNATCPQMTTVMKNPVATSSCSAAPPSIHPSPAPPTGSSKSAAEPQPMDLDRMKSKNPPWICYNCNKPGHIAHIYLEPHAHQVCNADVLSPETIQVIAEAMKVAVRGNAMQGDEAVDKIKPVSDELKDF